MENPSKINSTSSTEQVENFISFKEIILKIKMFGQELYLRKWWIGLVAILTAGFFIVSTETPVKAVSTYPATLIFILTENNGRDAGTILGQNNSTAIKRILKIVKTKNILYKVLFQKVKIKEKEDLLANHLIDIYKIHNEWDAIGATQEQQTINLTGFYFKQSNVDEFPPNAHKAAHRIYQLVMGLVEMKHDRSTNFLELYATTQEEELSILLLKLIYQELHDFYLQDVVEKPQHMLNLLQTRGDSILASLKFLETTMANYNKQQGYLSNKAHLKKGQLSRQISFSSATYREIIKNKEAVLFRLQNQTSLLKIIDQTYPPITANIPTSIKSQRLEKGLLGAITGAIAAIFWFVFRKSYRELMAD